MKRMIARDPQVQASELSPVGLQDRAESILEQLDECMRLSATIRSEMRGESESETKDVPTASNLDARMNEIYTTSCRVRADLESIARHLHPGFDKPKSVAKLGRADRDWQNV
jgi:hypothetical protein